MNQKKKLCSGEAIFRRHISFAELDKISLFFFSDLLSSVGSECRKCKCSEVALCLICKLCVTMMSYTKSQCKKYSISSHSGIMCVYKISFMAHFKYSLTLIPASFQSPKPNPYRLAAAAPYLWKRPTYSCWGGERRKCALTCRFSLLWGWWWRRIGRGLRRGSGREPQKGKTRSQLWSSCALVPPSVGDRGVPPALRHFSRPPGCGCTLTLR